MLARVLMSCRVFITTEVVTAHDGEGGDLALYVQKTNLSSLERGINIKTRVES